MKTGVAPLPAVMKQPALPLPPTGSPTRSRARVEVVQVAPPNRFQALDAEKLRGGYYTPQNLADWLAKWAIRTPEDSFLEPSCGDGAVLAAGVARLKALGAADTEVASLVQGIELTPPEAMAARNRIAGMLGQRCDGIVETGDFFAWLNGNRERRFKASGGNPPFIRYQSFPEPARTRAMELMESVGLRPNKLTNIWVPFIVGATEALEPGGRLALVIPAELLQVSYAAQLRAYLTERFAHVAVVTCNELFFHGAEQEVVLLLAEGCLPCRTPGNHCRIAVVEARTVKELVASDPHALLASAEEKDIRGGDGEKWLKLFLTGAEIEFMREIRRHPRVAELKKFARVDVGIVTGNNGFFVLRASELKALGLTGRTVPLISRSAHLKGAIVGPEEWKALADADERVNLLNLRQVDGETLDRFAAAYVRQGEADGVHLGYKCSIRKPWFHVPSLWNPDAFLFRQIHDFPRFVRNDVVATATDTIHRVTAHGCDPAALVAATFTHLTASSAELVGRSYGGGVLELEPTEAERLLVPDALNSAVPLVEADRLVRDGRLADLLEENDRVILRGQLGLSKADCTRLKAVWAKMRNRRMARGKRPGKSAQEGSAVSVSSKLS